MRKCIAVPIVVAILLAAAACGLCDSAAATGDAIIPSSSIAGRVVGSSGKPIVGAELDISVTWEDKSAERGYSSKSEKITTDKDGRFTSTLPYEQGKTHLSIFVRAEGYCSTRLYPQNEDVSLLTLTMALGQTLKGVVSDEKGKPISGAKVTLERCMSYNSGSTQYGEPGKPQAFTTGKDGSFQFKGLPRAEDVQYADMSFSVVAPGRALMKYWFSKEGLSGPLKLTDPLECKIDGTLYLPGKSGPAPEKTQLMVVVLNNRGSESRTASVDAQGKFHFSQLPPGKVSLMLNGQGYSPDKVAPLPWAMPAVTDIQLSPKQPKRLDLVLVPGQLASGKITDKATGKGVAKARLSITHPGKPSYADYAITGDDGDFSVRVVPGNVSVIVEMVEKTGSNPIYFDYESRPTTGFKVTDGQDKTDVAMAIDLTDDRQSVYEVQSKPIPPDFELVPGTYDLKWDPDFDCNPRGDGGSPTWASREAIDASKLPKLVSDRSKHFWCGFDGPGNDGKLLIAADESAGAGKGWDTIYVDTNRNGDLTDEQPLHIPNALNNRTRSEWVTVQAHQGPADGVRTDHPVQVRVVVSAFSADNVYMELCRRGSWKGTIDTNKGTVGCAVVDSNFNGVCGDAITINDKFQYVATGDSLYANTNGFDRLVALGYGPHCINLNKVTKVGGKFYDITFSPLGDKVTVAPYSGGMGELLVFGKNIQGLKATAQSLYVMGTAGYFSFENSDGKPVLLPAGTYKIGSVSMALKTSNRMNLTCTPDSPITIEDGKQTTVPITGMLTMAIQPDVQKLTLAPGSSQSINWDIKLGGAITVTGLTDCTNANVPKVLFIKNGEIVGETSAQPG